MRLGPLPCAIAVASMVLAGPARADDAAGSAASTSLAKAFLSLCMGSISDLDRLERSAGSLGWTRLEGAEAKTFAAPSPDATTKTWHIARYGDVAFWLSIAHGLESGKSVSACTITNVDLPAAPVRAALIDSLGLKHSFRVETIGSQDYTYWQTKSDGISVIVSLVNATSDAATGVNISATLIPVRAFQ